MKKSYLIGLLCVAALAGLITITKAPAQGNQHRDPHHVVIIGEDNAWHYGPYTDPFSGEQRTIYIQDGLIVGWVEASPNAPRVELKSSLSAAIVFYMERGFSHEVLPGQSLRHLFKK